MGCSPLDVFETLAEEFRISTVEADVVLRGAARFEANCAANNESDCLSLGLADALRCAAPTLVPVHEFVRYFVRQGSEFLSRRLAGQQRDRAICRGTTCRRDIFGIFESYALVGNEFREPLAILAKIAVHAADFWQRLAIRLTDIEHVGSAESDCDTGFVRLGFAAVLGLLPNDRGENQNALLALLHEAAQFVPSVETRDVSRSWLLRSDEHDIVP